VTVSTTGCNLKTKFLNTMHTKSKMLNFLQDLYVPGELGVDPTQLHNTPDMV
jgi:hypothetical protein